MALFDQLLSLATIIDYLEVHERGTKRDLQNRLEEKSLPYSDRTFERLKEQLYILFGMKLIFENRSYRLDKTNQLGNQRMMYLTGMIRELESFEEEIHHPEISRRIIPELSDKPKYFEHMPIITKAILNQQMIQFEYFLISANVSHKVSLKPYLMKQYNKRWYVIGAKSNDEIRVYALDRISKLEITSESFSYDDYEELAADYHYRIGLSPGEEGIRDIRLKVHSPQHHYLRFMPFHQSQKELEWHENFSIIQVSLEVNFELMQKLLMLSDQVEVLSPESVSEELVKRIIKAQKRNQHVN